MMPRLFRLLVLPGLVALTAPWVACSSLGDSSGEARRADLDTPSYQAQQPFGDNPPPISTFYDSSYEESIYSPFSFN